MLCTRREPPLRPPSCSPLSIFCFSSPDLAMMATYSMKLITPDGEKIVPCRTQADFDVLPLPSVPTGSDGQGVVRTHPPQGCQGTRITLWVVDGRVRPPPPSPHQAFTYSPVIYPPVWLCVMPLGVRFPSALCAGYPDPGRGGIDALQPAGGPGPGGAKGPPQWSEDPTPPPRCPAIEPGGVNSDLSEDVKFWS